jgi:DNA helicase-2/ATP-dependent DNA helicase PcrA
MDIDNINEHINKLNAEQQQAATYGDGGVLVLAAAGSGKTSTLTCRIAYLISHQNIPAHNILAVTFTNKAAKEMIIRLQKMGVDTKALWIGTFHGICNKILRYHAIEAGIKKNFYIMDQQEQLSFLKRVCRTNGYDPKALNINDIQNKINGYKEVGWRSNQLRQGSQERNIYELYEQACLKDNCLDFAELMLGCYELFMNHQQIADAYAEKFRHILVDEFQDTSELQYKWLRLLAKEHKNIFAVGDDDQCLPKGTLVDTPNGQIEIQNLDVGHLVNSKIGTKTVVNRIINKFKHDFNGSLVKIELENGTILKSTEEHVWFANFIKKSSPQKYFTYLMFKNNLGYRIGTSRMHSGSDSLIGVCQRCQHEHADKIWILSVHDNAELAHYDEIKYSLKYGIPTIPFSARISKNKKTETIVSNQSLLEKLFKELDTFTSAKILLKDKNLSFDRPHHISSARDSNKNNITLILCADSRSNIALHSLEFFTNSKEVKNALESNGFKLELHKQEDMFRYRKMATDYNDIFKLANDIEGILQQNFNFVVSIIQKGKIGSQTLLQTMAKNILPGMIMVDSNGDRQIVKHVDLITEKTEIYDLNIENTHNYIANGIVTHNSIYGFRGAKPENLNLLKKDFNANVIKIEKNYRSDAYILQAANAVINNNTNRQGKNLVPTKAGVQMIGLYTAFNDEQESGYVSSEIKKLRRAGIPYKNMAILYRTNGQSRSLEKALTSMAIPYLIYGGFRFFDRQEVKHAMAYLRLANNPNDNMAFIRVANLPARAIGEAAIKKLEITANENNSSLFEMAKTADTKTIKKFESFVSVIETLQDYCKGKKLPEMVKTVIINSGLEQMYESDKKEGEERLDNLYELISAAEVFVSENINADIDEFLAFSTLETNIESNKRDENADAIKMMTVHSSKGLEFDVVFVTGLEETLFPHANAIKEPALIEEERRLMYVAITRAKDALYLTNCEERLLHGQRNRFIRSRFLKEIPQNLIQKLN